MGHSRLVVIFHILVLGTPREPRSEVAPWVLPLAPGTDSPKLHSRDSSKGIKVQSRGPGVSGQGYRDIFA